MEVAQSGLLKSLHLSRSSQDLFGLMNGTGASTADVGNLKPLSKLLTHFLNT